MTSMSVMLRYGSVCSGIEAASLAWQPLGLTPAWFSEIDPFANAVLRHHYPLVPNLGDMAQIAPQVRSGAICAPDVLVGGTPCQSFSIAGMRRGLEDPRGTLTLRFVELANAIDEIRTSQEQDPAICVWENVPGVLSDRANAFGHFLGALCGEQRELQPPGRRWTDAGCIYGPTRSVAWRVLDAQYFGVAQRRRRVFVVASARDDVDTSEVLFEREGVRRDTAPSSKATEGSSPSSESRAAGPSQTNPQSTLIQCFGAGNTRSAVEHAACLMGHGPRYDFELETFAVQSIRGDVSHTLTAAHDATEDGGGRGVPVVAVTCSQSQHEWPARFAPVTLAFAENSRGELRWENRDGQKVGSLSKGGGKPGQGMPVVLSLRLRGRQRKISHAQSKDSEPPRLGPAPVSIYPSLDAHFECSRRLDKADAPSAWISNWRVRRMMPIECERLQGMPDDYTLVPFRGHLAADGPRYRAIGESMAVPCMNWIGRRIIAVLGRSALSGE